MKGYYFCCFDLKSCYHHISVNPDHQKYLGFSWTYKSGVTLYFVFVVVPFGLCSACYLLMKMLRPFVKRRGARIRCTIYLDDDIFGSFLKDIVAAQCSIITRDLHDAGFTLNEEKFILYPVQKATWFGFVINTMDFTFSVPDEKLQKLQNLLTTASRFSHAVSAR